MKTVKLEVYGRVQGVNMRNNTKEYCERNNIKGTIVNNRNGSVDMMVQGEQGKVDELIFWLKSCPGFSKVEKLEIKEVDIDKKYRDFKIIKDMDFFRDQKNSIMNLRKSFMRRFKK